MGQQGNVLFLILIAVALFAALSYAVSLYNRGGQESAAREKEGVTAGKFLQYISRAKINFDRMMIGGNCTTRQVTFENSISQWASNALVHPIGQNASAPPSKRCHFYDSAGGGMEVWVLPQDLLDSAPAGGQWKPGNPIIMDMAVTGAGSAADDLVLVYPFMDFNTCYRINQQLGITNPSATTLPSGQVSATMNVFNGVFDGTATGNFGRNPVCASWGGNPHDNHFYYILMER